MGVANLKSTPVPTPERHTLKTQRVRPKKPWKDFPLFPHRGGTWAKKIDGKHKHFGPWSDPKGAYERYDQFMGAARLGIGKAKSVGSMTVEDIIDGYMTHQHGRVNTKQLSLRSLRDCDAATFRFGSGIGLDRVVSTLGPAEFTAYANSLSALGASAFNRNVAIIRGMFKWAFNSNLIDALPRYGLDFATRDKSAKRREQSEHTRKHGLRLFTADEIRKMLAAAQPSMKAMILLAINTGLGNSDLGRLTDNELKSGGVLDYARPKTGIARRAILWPETVKAIAAWKKVRPRPKNPDNARVVFITKYGVPFVREQADTVDGVVQSVTVVDSIALNFGKLLKTLGIKNRSFYDLRATFRTWATETKSEQAILRIMGHAGKGVNESYILDIPDHDLRSVTNHVRAKLFRRSRST